MIISPTVPAVQLAALNRQVAVDDTLPNLPNLSNFF